MKRLTYHSWLVRWTAPSAQQSQLLSYPSHNLRLYRPRDNLKVKQKDEGVDERGNQITASSKVDGYLVIYREGIIRLALSLCDSGEPKNQNEVVMLRVFVGKRELEI